MKLHTNRIELTHLIHQAENLRIKTVYQQQQNHSKIKTWSQRSHRRLRQQLHWPCLHKHVKYTCFNRLTKSSTSRAP